MPGIPLAMGGFRSDLLKWLLGWLKPSRLDDGLDELDDAANTEVPKQTRRPLLNRDLRHTGIGRALAKTRQGVCHGVTVTAPRVLWRPL